MPAWPGVSRYFFKGYINLRSTKSIIKIVCDLYNIGIKNIDDILNNINNIVCRHTIYRYLKIGKTLGLCNYIPSTFNPIVCITTNQWFESIRMATRYFNIKSKTSIMNCCDKKIKATKNPLNKEKLVFIYYDEYLQQSSESEINSLLLCSNL
jgi:hypothetical protein